MFDPGAPHPELSTALDIADKAIKLLAVLLGGIWTWWNYKKSRTYKQKMELQIEGSIFSKAEIYYEVKARLKNLGATRHSVERTGSYCEIRAVLRDLTEQIVDIQPVFTRDSFIEPGETISDLLVFRLSIGAEDIVWLRIDLRVVSKGIEWHEDGVIRVLPDIPAAMQGLRGE